MSAAPPSHSSLASALPASHVALMVTRRCNMSCSHCSVESSPQVKGEPQEAALLGYVREAAAVGVRSILLTGGEPMLRADLVLRLLRECQRLGLVTSMTTNGFWGKNLRKARQHVRALRRAGLGALTVSYDRYHAAFQGHNPVLHIARAAEELSFPVNINVVREAKEPELDRLVAPFEGSRSARLRFYDLQPIGRARDFSADALRSGVAGFCGACAYPAITDDGRLTACNGPSYFVGPESPLQLGSLQHTSLHTLLLRHWQDPILDTIRTFGPSRLREELEQIPEFAAFPFRKQYHGLCDLCHHMTANPEVVTALRRRLAQPQREAERRAAWQVIEHSRRGGALSRDHVNGVGAGRVFLRAAWEQGEGWADGAEKVLGRADLDWSHQATYLTACGLARPLLKRRADPALTRWAPQFFLDRLQTRALHEGFRDLVQREILRRLSGVLAEVGGEGVLLKGAARLAQAEPGEDPSSSRAAGDIDVYIEPSLASAVRTTLIERGFQGAVEAHRTASHHLAPITFRGVPVEIHTRIMPAFWGLPEKDMLAHARPVPGMASLSTLDPEGFLLHAGMHAATHLFALGLKTAWDLLWILEKHSSLDWERLAGWVNASSLPRGFWVPVRVLCQELGVLVPAEFLCRAPADTRQRKLETIARHRLFRDLDDPLELNLFSTNAVFLLLHDSWLGRARYLANVITKIVRPSQRSAQRTDSAQVLRHLPRELRQAYHHWQQYRRARARA